MAAAGEQTEFMNKEAPGYMAEQVGYNVVAVLCSIGLLVAAIGLFMGSQFGRIVQILVSLVMILAVLGNTIYTVAFIFPAAKKFQNQQMAKVGGAPPPKGAFEVGGVIGVVIALLIGAGYPALTIALMMTPSVRQYVSGDSGGRRRRDEYDDYASDDYDRRRDDDYDR